MTDQTTTPQGGSGDEPDRPRFTDKRRIDPETGAVREQPVAPEAASAASDGAPDVGPGGEADAAEAGASPAEALAAERLEDLQRLQAEYVNYRRRVDRDRLVARDQTVVAMVEAMMGVLDEIELARQHGELAEGPFASIADKLEASLAKFGWERFGAAGEPFDPTVHEALMHAHSDDVTEPTVVQVLQPGHRVGERIVRAARVAVAEPEG
ncbi:nucleotide exchange factor GrpE [Actinotalea ferrariae]|uniref:nucleotide exchange factor GrpE n=1 Tax=Actinotalea ferrariae TaxID=1386098 RepID=UPI001C8C238A|nr:nucleotide exchange factor GrpE [Actinotalea ferrariae]MBX9244331.1 nucleotide exchange factor GrpE [Actinotalea ferrariae]